MEPDDFRGRKCQVIKAAMSDVSGKQVSYTGGGQLRSINLENNGKQSSSNTMIPSLNIPDMLRQSEIPYITSATESSSSSSSSSSYQHFIHLISLDVEGHELEVLSVFEFETIEVGAWIIENNKKTTTEIIELLLRHDYKIRNVDHKGVDLYFVKDKYWDSTLLNKKLRIHPVGSWGC